MTDRYLTGNGRPCTDCGGRGTRLWGGVPDVRCTTCGGSGRVALPDEEIVAAHVDEARRVYWPAWDGKVEERR